MKVNTIIRYTGPDNEVTLLKSGDTGTVLMDYEDGYFEVEFLNPDGTIKVLEVLDGEFLEIIK